MECISLYQTCSESKVSEQNDCPTWPQFRLFQKLEIFKLFPAPIQWRVLKWTTFMRRRGSGCVPFRAKSSTAAKRASLRCKLGSERSEQSSRRKHSFI